ncbi:RND transporter [Chromobacterium sp. LK1]|uniref:efflux RND transporter permease subunit n=1 Tax=Chromobacterium sp. LK1 TaxID=1628193 RepID=UPI000653B0D5|nr:multidrug efflux RND transporter permease subunit [Chromobacterium sp. LK1]KMN36362.1 RND transporter [Chromobacterium sp. LK1]
MFSAFFIRRPIFASVISIVITLAGLAALKALPIEQYPEIVPPMISVSASYPGASAEVIANTVASPLEQAINGVDDMLYVQSTSSSSGKLSLSVTFKIGTDADQATINVNNRVQSVLSQLPEEVRRQGVNVTKKSSAFLQVISLFSPDKTYDTLFISNYALLNVVDELKRVPGVGDVINFAGQDYSMRVWLKPDRLAQLKLTPSDVAAAIREQNAQFAAGKVGAEPVKGKQDFTYTVTTQGRLSEPEEFENIILRSNPDGSAVRLKDVARVELGALSYDFTGTHNGRPTIPIGIFLAPGANQLATAQAVEQTMQKLAVSFPKGLNFAIPYDTTKFVEVSIKEVYSTLGEAMVLVFLVVFLFLQNWRATLIPCLAVPVSIIGTFAGMYAFGFTINTLTLFGLVLAIGIVVDDAIVVLENVERLMTQEKLSPLQASFKAMDEVSGALVAIVLVLCSVFIPVAFLGGIAGQMYKQFAITIAVSVSISGLVALTLTPALCALLLKEGHQHPARFFVWFNNWFDRLTQGYSRGVVFLIKRSAVGILLFAGLIAICVGLFRMIPSSLAPDEDQGYIIAAAFLPDGASMQRTSATMTKLDAMTSKNPAVKDVMSFAGFDILTGGNKTNAGVSFITLKPWDERKAPNLSSQAVVGDTFAKGMMGITDGIVLAFNPPPISGMSNTGGFEAYVQSRGGASSVELGEVTKKLVAAAAKRPELKGVQTTFSASVPQIYVKLDRAKAKSLGVPVNTVFDTMQSTFGALYVNDFNKFGRTFRVQLQSEADFRTRVEDLRNIYVRSQDGNMIPLTALVTIKHTTGPESLERFNIFPAAKLVGGPAPGFSSGEALNVLEAVAKETLPDGYTLAWTGSAFQEKSTSGSSAVVFGFGMIMVFLILAAQYERWSLPISVLMAVPFAMFGALMANWLRGLANDVYFQVALVTLIGLSAKNAILIVEFAVQQMEEEGLSVVEAAIAAAKLRFRPIVMTSLAFVLGCMPLAISSGAGSASRHSIGTGVVGGMLAATFIATFFIPMFFMLIMKFSKPKQPQPTAEAGDKADA